MYQISDDERDARNDAWREYTEPQERVVVDADGELEVGHVRLRGWEVFFDCLKEEVFPEDCPW